jgi:hypothetical protein
MIAFIDDHREAYGVEPICKVLPIAPSTYHAQIAQRIDVSKRSARAQRDSELKIEVQRVFAENFGVYGVRKVWRQLRREGFTVARCTVERLMASLGLQGAIRGKPVRTTISDKAVPCPLDHVNRQFHALRPNASGSRTSPTSQPGRASSTSPSSSTPTPVASWAGVSHGQHMRASCSMRWSRPSMIGGPPIAAGSYITATEAAKADSTGHRNILRRRLR